MIFPDKDTPVAITPLNAFAYLKALKNKEAWPGLIDTDWYEISDSPKRTILYLEVDSEDINQASPIHLK